MQKKQWDSLWINGSIATCEKDAGLMEQAGIAVKNDKIVWVGTMSSLSAKPETLAVSVHDLQGGCVTPGLVDCHTHLVYAGNRAHEFEMRLQGATYDEIARAGGGIQLTVAATRAASEDDLLAQSLVRARALMASGVTTMEIKSGYGLNWEAEAKILRVAERIGTMLPITICRTFLGAHTVPREYRDTPHEYVDLVCHDMIPRVAKEKLADAVDVFCEKIAFSLADTERVFHAAQQHGLAVKCPSEQLSTSGSAALAARFHALSVDHLEHLSPEGVRAIAASGTVAVLLPGAFYFLRDTALPPIHLLREHRVPIAIASDCNPGTSPVLSLTLMMNMACTLFRLTPDEALSGLTRHAAQALGMEKTHGTLSVGKMADFIVWNVKQPVDLAYHIGGNLLRHVIKSGKVIS